MDTVGGADRRRQPRRRCSRRNRGRGTRDADREGTRTLGRSTSGDDARSEVDRLGATLDSLLDPHLLLDPVRNAVGAIVDLRVGYANDAACRALERRRVDLDGASLLAIIPALTASGLFARAVATLETGDPIVLDGVAHRDPSWRQVRYFDIRAARVGDALAYSWRDVTATRRLERRYQLIAENASDVVLEVSVDGVIRWASPSVQARLGWSPGALIGRKAIDYAVAEDRGAIEAGRREALAGRTIEDLRCRISTGSGSVRWTFSASTRLANTGPLRVVNSPFLGSNRV